MTSADAAAVAAIVWVDADAMLASTIVCVNGVTAAGRRDCLGRRSWDITGQYSSRTDMRGKGALHSFQVNDVVGFSELGAGRFRRRAVGCGMWGEVGSGGWKQVVSSRGG